MARPIGGGLIVIGIGLLILPFRLLVAVVEAMEPITSDVWPLLATPGAPHYHPLLAPLVVDLALAQIVPVLRGVDRESMLDIAGAAGTAAILIPYLRTSGRVTATFVE